MFSGSFWLIFFLVAGAVVVSLSAYAISLLLKVKKQKVDLQQAQDKKLAANKEHDNKILGSVSIITRAMQAEQCDFSEGCWRLCVLLASLKTTNGLETEFPAIFELYNEIKHMPILAERKKLDKKERMKLDYQRMKLESSLYADINRDLNLLLQYTHERQSVLQKLS